MCIRDRISSASVSFTPGDRPGRSSSSTRRPAAARAVAASSASASGTALPAATTWTSAGATAAGQHNPRSSAVCSASAATARETPMPYEPIVTRTGLPSRPRTSSPKASAYLRPSWKMCPISMARSSFSPAPQDGQGSPGSTTTTSRYRSTSKSRPQTTFRACVSARLAPVTHEVPGATRGSAR